MFRVINLLSEGVSVRPSYRTVVEFLDIVQYTLHGWRPMNLNGGSTLMVYIDEERCMSAEHK